MKKGPWFVRRDDLLRLLGARSSSRARSHAHGRLPIRATLHLLLIGLAAIAVLLTAHLVTDAKPDPVSDIPPVPLSGVRAIAPTGETLLRPGVSHKTVSSPRRVSLPHRRAPVTPDFPVPRPSTGTGCGEQPIANQIDPPAPYVLYTVKAGDTLGEIAESCDTTVDIILDNNAEVDAGGLIVPGEQILVPLGQVPGILYKVGHGETLHGIINRYWNVTVQEVIDHRPNNLSSPDDIEVGTYVLLPNAELKTHSPEGHPITQPPPVSAGRFGLPLAAWSFISDPYGTDRGEGRIHTGIDLALGGYPASSVYAACDGRVSRTEWLTWSYGYYVIVDCGDGWETLYSHFREIIVAWGQSVTKGVTILGISGSTGYSTGEHLHFEIRYNGTYLDPAEYIHFPDSRHP